MTMAVLDNPAVNILGHMFGMSYRRFGQEPSPKKIKSIIQKAAEKRIVFEINSHYHRNYRQLLDWCREYDAVISFGSNAHATADVGKMTRLFLHGKADV